MKPITVRKILLVAMVLCLGGAVCILGRPASEQFIIEKSEREQIERFENRFDLNHEDSDTGEAEVNEQDNIFVNLADHSDREASELDRLWEDAVEFNRNLYEDGLMGVIRDYKGTQALDFDLTNYGFEDHMFGYIEIPKINLRMCLYTYSSKSNLFAGACRLSNTSIPIGGDNTNAVIAGHSGYSDPMFTNIGKLEHGDKIYITNPWGTMVYKVVGRDKVLPTDLDAIGIQPGRDLITLLTCTPIHVNTHRLLVYCERVDD